MAKMKELSEALDGLAECGHGLAKMAEALKRYYAIGDAKPPTKKPVSEKKKEPSAEVAPVAPTPEPEAEYSKEHVRKLLAKAANNGHREAVKDIIQKHGVSSLSQIDPSEYASIVKAAEVLANA